MQAPRRRSAPAYPATGRWSHGAGRNARKQTFRQRNHPHTRAPWSGMRPDRRRPVFAAAQFPARPFRSGGVDIWRSGRASGLPIPARRHAGPGSSPCAPSPRNIRLSRDIRPIGYSRKQLLRKASITPCLCGGFQRDFSPGIRSRVRRWSAPQLSLRVFEARRTDRFVVKQRLPFGAEPGRQAFHPECRAVNRRA